VGKSSYVRRLLHQCWLHTATTCSAPTAAANRANCEIAANYELTVVGSYLGSASPYGSFDQGGNILELTETISRDSVNTPIRVMRGGSFVSSSDMLASSARTGLSAGSSGYYLGFRLAMIPEPGTGLLVIAGLLGLTGRRRARN
jgi:formylglycine-generating enzyme required for sulfatase activity